MYRNSIDYQLKKDLKAVQLKKQNEKLKFLKQQMKENAYLKQIESDLTSLMQRQKIIKKHQLLVNLITNPNNSTIDKVQHSIDIQPGKCKEEDSNDRFEDNFKINNYVERFSDLIAVQNRRKRNYSLDNNFGSIEIEGEQPYFQNDTIKNNKQMQNNKLSPPLQSMKIHINPDLKFKKINQSGIEMKIQIQKQNMMKQKHKCGYLKRTQPVLNQDLNLTYEKSNASPAHLT